MGWLRRTKAVLLLEPETWLAYIYGQQFDKLRHLQDAEPRHKGWYFRVAIWLYLLLKNVRLKHDSSQIESDYLVFSGTMNQKKSLESTLCELTRRKTNVYAIAPRKILTKNKIEDDHYNAIYYSFLDVLKSVFLCVLRLKQLRNQLKDRSELLTRNRLDSFLEVYNSLVYFDRLLIRAKPKVVIVSNDHNAFNKTLIALARNMGIKTVYMQHASVSDLFPALNVDYAFLDGESALETYRKCEKNNCTSNPLIKNRKVFLTGQKKRLNASYSKIQSDKVVGLALNALDSLIETEKLVRTLSENGLKVRLRWHPGLSSKVIKELKKTLEGYSIEFSDPKIESLSDFFSHIRCLIAGNSSIHLEAALSHVVPIQYEIGKSDFEDYYGYVRNRVSFGARSIEGLLSIVERVESNELRLDKTSIQFYSSTFGTEWEGREGELVCQILMSIGKNPCTPISCINL